MWVLMFKFFGFIVYKTKMNVANLLTCALPSFFVGHRPLIFFKSDLRVTASTFLVFSRSQRKIKEGGGCAVRGRVFIYQYLHIE